MSAPDTHDGTPFIVGLRFSEPIVTKPKDVRGDYVFTVTGGDITKAARLNRVQRSNGEGWMASRWELTVRPDGLGDVTT